MNSSLTDLASWNTHVPWDNIEEATIPLILWQPHMTQFKALTPETPMSMQPRWSYSLISLAATHGLLTRPSSWTLQGSIHLLLWRHHMITSQDYTWIPHEPTITSSHHSSQVSNERQWATADLLYDLKVSWGIQELRQLFIQGCSWGGHVEGCPLSYTI